MTTRDEQLTEATQERDAMMELLASDGWKILNPILQSHVDQRTRILEEPLENADAVFRGEAMKGARQAFRLVQALPQSIIDTSKDVIEAIANERISEDGEGTDPELDFGDADSES